MAYLAERYAHLLSKEDVLELFQDLVKAYQENLSEACRKCGIQRKTAYDWARARSLRLSTKKKVLEALIKTKPERTLDFLLARSKETTVDLLSLNLSYVYTKAMAESTDPRSFVDAVKKFEKIKSKHIGLTWELEEEMGDMTYHLREKALTLQVPLATEFVDVIKPSQMLEMIPSVVSAISRRRFASPSQLATDLKVPENLVQVISQAIGIPIFGAPRTETAQSGLPFDIGELPPTASVEYPRIWERQAPWEV